MSDDVTSAPDDVKEDTDVPACLPVAPDTEVPCVPESDPSAAEPDEVKEDSKVEPCSE